MTCEEFEQVASGVASLATTVALIVGGWWTWLRFVRNRESRPRVEFSVDLEFVRKQGGFWVVEAVAYIDNKGYVRHALTNFTFDIRYLSAMDPVKAKERFHVNFPTRAVKDSWIPRDKTRDGQSGDWGMTFVDPGVRTRYSHPVRIPEDATIALIHGKFYYDDNEWHTSDKLVAVP